MTSRQFFGRYKFTDIKIEMFNEQNELIYEYGATTFAYAHPVLKDEINYALEDYSKNWVNKGQPCRMEIFTTPSWNSCTIDLKTMKKTFEID